MAGLRPVGRGRAPGHLRKHPLHGPFFTGFDLTARHSSIVMASPALAIGGTVYGMLNAFGTLNQAGNADPSVLAGHISVALLTTLWSFINMIPFIILGIVCTKRHRFWKRQLADLPERERDSRRKLRKKLVASGFGCMQRSAWISPDPLAATALELRPLAVNAAHLVLLDSTPCGGESSSDIVRAAWDLKRIDGAWKNLDDHLAAAPDCSEPLSQASLVRWLAKERDLLKRCFRLDPLLPKALLPAHYHGMAIWKRRRKVLSKLTKNIGRSAGCRGGAGLFLGGDFGPPHGLKMTGCG